MDIRTHNFIFYRIQHTYEYAYYAVFPFWAESRRDGAIQTFCVKKQS